MSDHIEHLLQTFGEGGLSLLNFCKTTLCSFETIKNFKLKNNSEIIFRSFFASQRTHVFKNLFST